MAEISPGGVAPQQATVTPSVTPVPTPRQDRTSRDERSVRETNDPHVERAVEAQKRRDDREAEAAAQHAAKQNAAADRAADRAAADRAAADRVQADRVDIRV